MPTVPDPTEIGFTEFVAKLVADSFDGIVASLAEQERRHAEAAEAAALDEEDFADGYIDSTRVQGELAQLFPAREPGRRHGVYEGAPYEPAGERGSERPPFGAALDLVLGREDYVVQKERRETTLTAVGVHRIERAAALRVAREQLVGLRALVRRGLPRVMVDSGRIKAKVSYRVVRDEAYEEETEARRRTQGNDPVDPSTGIRFGHQRLAPELRLVVRPIDERAPEANGLAVDVLGEVEINFKTISS